MDIVRSDDVCKIRSLRSPASQYSPGMWVNVIIGVALLATHRRLNGTHEILGTVVSSETNELGEHNVEIRLVEPVYQNPNLKEFKTIETNEANWNEADKHRRLLQSQVDLGVLREHRHDLGVLREHVTTQIKHLKDNLAKLRNIEKGNWICTKLKNMK